MNTIIKNAKIVNNGTIIEGDVLIKNEEIVKIAPIINEPGVEINANGNYLIPGVIDDQVHFREPGLTHKATIYSESRAALAGGVTSFMEMPNVNPQTITNTLLEEKMQLGAKNSAVNYSFYLGATNTNLEEVKKVDIKNVCGVKAFMGSSTGDMLVDNQQSLEQLFANCPTLLATHCEDETRIKNQTQLAIQKYGNQIPPFEHANIRDAEACYINSSFAVNLAKKHQTRLHVLHITTAKEISLFTNQQHRSLKNITAEACVHHLHFTNADYSTLGNLIKCNPAVKTQADKDAVWQALLTGFIDVVATDHAPHTWDEKQLPYLQSPSGLPLIQHGLQLMLQYVKNGKITIENMVDKMCHAAADIYKIPNRGYIQEGFKADLVLLNHTPYQVLPNNIKYLCGWSPFTNTIFEYSIDKVWVNGTLSWNKGNITQLNPQRLVFNR